MPKVATSDVELFFEISGRAGAPWIVFSNALGATLEMWDGVIERFGRDYACLRYDTRGHGRSSSSDRAVTIDDLAEDLAAVLDVSGIDSANVVGLSLGGMTAQALAAVRPQRVRSLVLMATAPHLPPPEPWRQRAATVRANGMAAVVDAVIARWFTAPFYAASPATVAKIRERFLASEPRGYARCAEAIAAMDLRPRLAAISAATLVVAGAEDGVVPPAVARDLAARIADANFTVVDGAAHLVAAEQPAATAALVADHIRDTDTT